MFRLVFLGNFVFAILGAFTCASADADAKTSDFDFFETRIRPVLVKHCYECHSAAAEKDKKLKGELLLDTRLGIRTGGETGPAVVPGKVAGSLIMPALQHKDGLEMPPKGKLPKTVIDDFAKWIQTGAADPRDGKSAAAKAIDWKAARDFWSFQVPRTHPRPKTKNAVWAQREWDHFILTKLEVKELSPVGFATKRELIRRATFDLTGLPPTAQEVADFETDASPQAFTRVVDRLLASSHYGERWGRYWLDVARYADDKALAYANPWPNAWRYRDWVVKAFNDDMPYDRFLRLQLAGDLMTEPKTDYTQRLAGLGFQGLGAFYHKGSVAEQVKADELDDRIDTLSRGLLGLTVACARCHDHKYDPVPTRDYYSLATAYNGANWSEVALAPPDVIARYNDGQRPIKEQTEAIAMWLRTISHRESEKRFQSLRHTMQVAWRLSVLQANGVKASAEEIAKREKLHTYFLGRVRDLLSAAKKNDTVKRFPQLADWFKRDPKAQKATKYEAVTVPEPIRQLAGAFQARVLKSLQEHQDLDREYEQALAAAKTNAEKKAVKRKPLGKEHEQFLKNLYLDGKAPLHVDDANTERHLLSETEKPQLAKLRAELEKRKKSAPPKYAMAHGVVGGGASMPVFIRGNVKRKGETAPPGFLQVLRPAKNATPSGQPSPTTFTRLQLADAICSKENPLTARVIVNRVWQHHFGRGIVASASNFGTLGSQPTHQELLDTLAVRFMEAGWSIKWLHREMMLTAAYQLGSSSDEKNVSIDPGNRLLWRFTPRRMDIEAWRDAILVVSDRLDRKLGGPAVGAENADHVRRTLYGMVSRRDPNKMMIAFDFPDANVSSARRDVTTVPQQQLFVLNSDFMIASAEALAARLGKVAASDKERVTLAYRWAYSRKPTADEMQFCMSFLRSAEANGDKKTKNQLSAWGQLAQAILAANEFAWID